MKEEETLKIINIIFNSIFKLPNYSNLKEVYTKYAFDIKLPKEVRDSTTNEITYADSINSQKFITLKNMEQRDMNEGWMLPKQNITGLKDIITIWNQINYTTTERVYDSINVSLSDTIYRCQNIYHSTGCSDSKNLVFCDNCANCEYLIASQRSFACSFCIRTDDSKDCTNSYNVICSNKISNSYFIQDCFNLHECLFCSHIANKKYCIANMQFSKEEYYQIKEKITKWIINS